ncbi:hypothetical protein BDY19DRAFT_929880 [Irpex rosettiformis]|uniref:Uncharacterized protein n=1 Tax=Irpex rosettiformis TaxID=378272 RepID=A0ACB8UDG5_9APHY|nr:hypothetical protein BDY19DRAFT_929880 [Irpex rosettiformis]
MSNALHPTPFPPRARQVMSGAIQPIIPYPQQEEALEAITKLINDSNVSQMNLVAVTTWVGYDILLTFVPELETMWRRNFFSMPSIIYFIMRYLGFGFLAFSTVTFLRVNTFELCAAWGILLTITLQVVSLMVNGLLALRVYAFFYDNKYIKPFVIGLWLSEAIIEVTLLTFSAVKSGNALPPPRYLPIYGCVMDVANSPYLTISAWIANTVYSVICLGLLIYKFLTIYVGQSSTKRIAKTCLQDGAMLFVMQCATNVLNMVLMYAVRHSPLASLGLWWFVGVISVAASRTILSLRERPKSFVTESIFSKMLRKLREPGRQDFNFSSNSSMDIPRYHATGKAPRLDELGATCSRISDTATLHHVTSSREDSSQDGLLLESV